MNSLDDTQTRVLEAAGQVFADKGFKAATIREICDRAGTNVASVNYYFRDKEKLYRAALHHAFECRLRPMPVPAPSSELPSTQKLRGFIGAIVRHMFHDEGQAWQMQLLLRELSQPTSAAPELVHDFIRPMYEILWSILREVLPADVTAAQLHLTAFSIIGQCFYLRVGRHVVGLVVGEDESRTYDADRIAEHILAFSFAALGLGRRWGVRRWHHELDRTENADW